MDPDAEFVEARATIGLYGGRCLDVDDDLRAAIEDYANASHVVGRPFADYRPDIGVHLLPSARTGGGIHRRTVRGVLERAGVPIKKSKRRLRRRAPKVDTSSVPPGAETDGGDPAMVCGA